jgi:hypothetical protein
MCRGICAVQARLFALAAPTNKDIDQCYVYRYTCTNISDHGGGTKRVSLSCGAGPVSLSARVLVTAATLHESLISTMHLSYAFNLGGG